MKRLFSLFLCALLLCACLIPASAEDKQENRETNGKITVLPCETLTGWTSEGELALDTEDETEGGACVSATLDAPAGGASILSLRATFDPVDATDMYLIEFDFYISDPALLWASRMVILDFGSAGTPDSELITWYETAFSGIDKAGWYHISLPVSEASSRGFRNNNLNYFCLQFFQVNPETDLNDVVVKIDNITATKGERTNIVMDNCDTADGWTDWGASPQRDEVNKRQGTASLTFQLKLPEQYNLVSQKVYEPVNAKGLAYVEMDVFVSDINVFKNANYPINFEITSSGTCDHQEYSWQLDKYVKKNGWTRISLPVVEGTECDGAPNFAAINYLRFHTLGIREASGGTFTFRVDNITFVTIKQGNAPYGATPIVRDPGVEPGPDDPGVEPGPENPGVEPGPENPGIDQPTQPPVEQPEKNENDLRARTTALRAKILLLVMAFVIIGIDVIAVALRHRNAEQPVLQEATAGDAPLPESSVTAVEMPVTPEIQEDQPEQESEERDLWIGAPNEAPTDLSIGEPQIETEMTSSEILRETLANEQKVYQQLLTELRAEQTAQTANDATESKE